jgi:hypothetical protein
MIRVSGQTHSFNPDQRFFDVPFTVNGNTLLLLPRSNPNIATPGYYMIFFVNGNGVPSIAEYTRLPATTEDSIAPTAPTNLVATGSLGQAHFLGLQQLIT